MNPILFLIIFSIISLQTNCLSFGIQENQKRCFIQDVKVSENLRLSLQFHAQAPSNAIIQTELLVNKKSILSTFKHSYNIIEDSEDDSIMTKFEAIKKPKEIEICFQYKKNGTNSVHFDMVNIAFHIATFQDQANPDEYLEEGNLSHNTYTKFLINMLKNSIYYLDEFGVVIKCQLSQFIIFQLHQDYWELQDHISAITYFKFAIALFVIIFQFWIITRFIIKKQSQQPQIVV